VGCNENKIDARNITRIEAEKYLQFISTKEYKPEIRYSTNTISAMIAAVCAFYRELQLRHSDTIKFFTQIITTEGILPRRHQGWFSGF
jgi:hypothetical protein